MASLLPLFPLDLVLFPGNALPLHIFEPRYKEMIGECRAEHKPFGVIRAVEQGIAEVGCTAEVVKVTREYADGRLDIVAEGRERFALMQVNQDRAFLRGEILLLDDIPSESVREETERALRLHADILQLAGAVQDLSGADQGKLSFYLAGSLPLDLDFKVRLLGMPSESRRIADLGEYLERILPNLRRAAHARERAGGNGHAR